MNLRRLPQPWSEAFVVAIAALTLFALTMPHVVTFEDAGLFDSVCYTGGIAHPPGYPLFTLLCTPLFQLPFEPAIIGNSMSALFGALGCGLLVVILQTLQVSRSVSVFGGALLAVTASFWSQAIIVEVYTLNALLFLAVLYLVIRFYQSPGRGFAWSICLVYALGIANHWPLMVLSFPGLAFICLARWDWIVTQIRDLRFWGMVGAMVLLGLSPYASLLLKKHLVVSFSGPIHGIDGLWNYFMRKSYATVDQQSAANITDKLQFAAWITRQASRETSPWLLPLLLPGLITGHRRVGTAVQVGLALVFVMNTYVLVALLGFDYEDIFTAVFRPYPILAWICLVIWMALGMQWLLERLAKATTLSGWIVAGLSAFGIVITFQANIGQNDRAHAHLADDYSRLVLQTVAKNAAIVATSDAQVFPLAYQYYVKGLRQDVSLYHINNLVYPNKLPGKTLQSHVDDVLAMAKRRPVYSIAVPELPDGTDYGIYRRFDMPGNPPAARDNQHAAFRHRLIEDYVAGRIRQPHNLYFTTQLLLSFSNQLLALGNREPLTAAEAKDLAILETTFPGTLATLYFALSHPAFGMDGQHLLDMAFSMEDNIPDMASSENRALFHYYFALLFLQGERGIDVNKSLARTFLLKSFEDWPTPKTPGLCLLIKLGPPTGHLSTTPPFASRCPARSG